MKRTLVLIAAAALLAQALPAQEAGEPDGDRVLETARAKFFEKIEQEIEERQEEAEEVREQAEAERRGEDAEARFTPVLLGFAPGLSIPMGYWDAAFSAGIIGVMTRDVSGFQAASILGMARDVSGFQAAGVFVMASGDVAGLQTAGIFSMAGGGVDGAQASGVFNMAGGKVSGVQLAGVFNIAGDLDAPVQAAGVFNIAHDVSGAQAAGVFNIAQKVHGAQIAPVVNVAGDVDGLQLGLINIANSVDGLQLGLINVARDPGLSSMGICYEPESDYLYAAFQAGSRGLYGVLSGGIPREDYGVGVDSLVLGYGLGTRLRLGRRLYVDADASAVSFVGPRLPEIGAAIAEGRNLDDWSSLVPYPSLRALVGLRVLGRLHLVGGVRVDVDLADAPMVPSALKTGQSWTSSFMGVGFTSWTKYYFGVKI